MITKYGLEKEFFVKKRGVFVLASEIPHDDCMYLAEARGLPHTCPVQAVYSLMADVQVLKRSARALKLSLLDAPYAKLPEELIKKALACSYKKLRDYLVCTADNDPQTQQAGLHIHFSNAQKCTIRTDTIYKDVEYPAPIDMPNIIQILDNAFEEDIRYAHRKLSQYRMKPHGFEYRSLPSTVNLNKVIDVLLRIQKTLSSI